TVRGRWARGCLSQRLVRAARRGPAHPSLCCDRTLRVLPRGGTTRAGSDACRRACPVRRRHTDTGRVWTPDPAIPPHGTNRRPLLLRLERAPLGAGHVGGTAARVLSSTRRTRGHAPPASPGRR